MQKPVIADNGNDVFIYLNRKEIGSKTVDRVISQIRLMFIDDSHIPEISDAEQAELESILDNLSLEEKEVGFIRRIEI